jgi:TonB family protein
MFDRVIARPSRRGLRVTVAVSTLIYGGAIVAAVVASMWTVDRLRPKYVEVTWAAPAAPPPPPRAEAAPAAPRPVSPKRTTAAPVVALTQPKPTTEPAHAPVEPSEPSSGEPSTGEPPGGEGGPPGPGVPGGTGTEPIAIPAPTVVSIQTLAALRIAGETQIRLPPQSLRALADEGVHGVDVGVRLCLDAAGAPRSIEVVKGSGSADIDERVREGVSAWRYRPFAVNGRPVPVCTTVVMRYEID